MRWLGALLLAGCGRAFFDPLGDAGGDSAAITCSAPINLGPLTFDAVGDGNRWLAGTDAPDGIAIAYTTSTTSIAVAMIDFSAPTPVLRSVTPIATRDAHNLGFARSGSYYLVTGNGLNPTSAVRLDASFGLLGIGNATQLQVAAPGNAAAAGDSTFVVAGSSAPSLVLSRVDGATGQLSLGSSGTFTGGRGGSLVASGTGYAGVWDTFASGCSVREFSASLAQTTDAMIAPPCVRPRVAVHASGRIGMAWTSADPGPGTPFAATFDAALASQSPVTTPAASILHTPVIAAADEGFWVVADLDATTLGATLIDPDGAAIASLSLAPFDARVVGPDYPYDVVVHDRIAYAIWASSITRSPELYLARLCAP